MPSEKVISVIDIGDEVICDLCNKQWTDDMGTGGCLVQSKGVCPDCTVRFLGDLARYGEMHLLKAMCPPSMSFHAFIMHIRGGDNTVRVTSFDSLDDLDAAVFKR